MITVNGKAVEAQEGESLLSLLERLDYRLDVIAVEHNGAIKSKADYALIPLQHGDRVEVVSFVGGG